MNVDWVTWPTTWSWKESWLNSRNTLKFITTMGSPNDLVTKTFPLTLNNDNTMEVYAHKRKNFSLALATS